MPMSVKPWIFGSVFVSLVIVLQAISFALIRFYRDQVIINDRAIFGLVGQSEVIVVLMLAAGFVLLRSWRTWSRPLAAWGFVLMVAGGLSNLFDRLVHGGVIDWIPFFHWFTFNGADLVITTGLGSVLATFLVSKKHVPGRNMLGDVERVEEFRGISGD